MTDKKFKKEKVAVFQSPKGMHDILPADQPWWEKVRSAAEEIGENYSFSRIDTPVLENAGIFELGMGEESEIVKKQMFVLKPRGGDRLALRPEGTAGIMRAYLQNNLSRFGQPIRLLYIGPMFRHEQPQAGRFRQFYQVGFEIIGDADPVYDAQIILVFYRFLERLKIKDIDLQLNTVGCPACRPGYVRRLRDYYRRFADKVCRDCRRRLEGNVLRVLDCKNKNCQPVKSGAPIILDFLCSICKNRFKKVLEFLDEVALPYSLNSYLVRGLDYYSRTVFEIFETSGSAALASGGRYDGLAEILKGRPTPGVGGALGMERVVEAMKRLGRISLKEKPKVFFIRIGEAAKQKGFAVVEELRRNDIPTFESLSKESLKAQLRQADKEKAALALIFGQKEVFEESIIIRDMRTGAQEPVPLKNLAETVKKRL